MLGLPFLCQVSGESLEFRLRKSDRSAPGVGSSRHNYYDCIYYYYFFFGGGRAVVRRIIEQAAPMWTFCLLSALEAGLPSVDHRLSFMLTIP